jgi:TatD DNase family protein
LDSSENAVKLTENYDQLYAAVGIHPHHAEKYYNSTEYIIKLEDLIKQSKVVAVGEIGLDLHEYKSLRVLRSDELQNSPPPNLAKQKEILHRQVSLALKLTKPVIFHCRDAYDELYKEIKLYESKVSGVVHCFMGSWQQAERFLNLGLYISFTGNLTYKNNDYIREVAAQVPEDKILIETDAPYLPPQSLRGMRNEPTYVKMVAESLVNITNWGLTKVIETTTKNAQQLFKIS